MNTIQRSVRIAAAMAVASLLTLTPARAAFADPSPAITASHAVSRVENCDANAASTRAAATRHATSSADVAQDQCVAAVMQWAANQKSVDWDAVNALVAACYAGNALDGLVAGAQSIGSSVWSAITSIF